MSVPMPKALRITALQALSDGNVQNIQSVVDTIAASLKLTGEQSTRRFKEGQERNMLHYRTSQALRFLTLSGFLANPERGQYHITSAGNKKLVDAVSGVKTSKDTNFYSLVAKKVQEIESFWMS